MIAAGALVVAALLAVAGTSVGAPTPMETMRLHRAPAEFVLKHFSFSDCAPANAPAHVTKLSISPDPVELPGNITVAAAAALTANISAPISAEVKLEKKVGVWVKIPCVDDVGSCSYDDLCKVLAKLIPLGPDGKCPAPLPSLGIACRCPLTPFNFNLPSTTFAAPSLPPDVPGWLSNGDYKVSVTAKSGGNVAFCIDLELSLKA